MCEWAECMGDSGEGMSEGRAVQSAAQYRAEADVKAGYAARTATYSGCSAAAAPAGARLIM